VSFSASFDSLRVRDGTVDTGDAVRLSVATDFGHLVRRVPGAVVRPGSVNDVVAVVGWAAEHGVPVTARGAGHSMSGQAQLEGGIVIDMTSLRQVHSVDREQIVVETGARWSTVLSATLPLGLAPPTLTDYLELTVGGTLSVGGVGGMSFRHGAQTDNVLALEVVTGDGRLVTCSPTRSRDLFDAVRAGFGRSGLIVRATIRLVPAPHSVRCYRLVYDDLRTFMADQCRLIAGAGPDYVGGYAKIANDGWRYKLEMATYETHLDEDDALLQTLRHRRDGTEVEEFGYGKFLDRTAPGVTARVEAGEWEWPHPWLNVFLPDSTADVVIERAVAELSPADLENFGLVLTYPIPTAALPTPLLRVPNEPITFLFALLLSADPRQPGAVDQMTARTRRIHELVRSAGGFLYPVGLPALTPDDWKAHYGPLWPQVTATKNTYDPHRILS
jgi:FAD/FMN-containing dehydrogenase